MAKQQSILKYRGSLDGIRHYKIKGLEGSYAAYVTPISADRIKKGAEFERTRENMNEFGGCGVITSSFRAGVAPLLSQMADNRMTARVIPLMKKINLEDQSEARGYRAILVSLQGAKLIKFAYNGNLLFRDVVRTPLNLTHAESRESATLQVAPFSPGKVLTVTAGTTHYRFVNVLSLLSDFAYDASTGKYEPVETTLNEKSVIAYSDYQAIGEDVIDSIDVTATLTGVDGLETAQVACIQSVGIEFVQKVGERYVLFSGSTMMVANVF